MTALVVFAAAGLAGDLSSSAARTAAANGTTPVPMALPHGVVERQVSADAVVDWLEEPPADASRWPSDAHPLAQHAHGHDGDGPQSDALTDEASKPEAADTDGFTAAAGGTSSPTAGVSPGQGFALFSASPRWLATGYTIRLTGTDARVEQYRDELVAAARAASSAAGLPVRVAARRGGSVNPARGEIVVVLGQGPCGSTAVGCGGPTMTSTQLVAGRVWVYPAGLSMSAAKRLNLAAHELGHALGLHHFTPNWTDGRQAMYPQMSGTSTYRAGDRAGLKYMAGGYDKPAGAVAGRAYAAGDMRVTGRLSSGSRVRVTVGAASAEVRTTGGRFAAAVPAPAGSHRVCVTVLDAAPGFRRDLGCAQVTAPGAPFGRIELASNSFETVSVSGWAADPQTAAPVHVEIRNNGALVATATASTSHPDVAKVYPHYGALHGYEVHIPAAAGANVVCARILGVGGGGHKDLGCRTVAHPVDPIGAFEVAVATDLGAVVTGWALDPNTPSPINVTVTVDGLVPPIPGTFQAADERRDIAQQHPAHGPHHGFSTRLVLTPGDHTICLTATNTGLGRDRSIGCTRARVDTLGRVEGVANPTFGPGTVGQAPVSEIVPVASELLSSTTRSANALLGPVA